METVFLEILNRSLSAGLLVLAVLLVRFVFRRMPKWAVCLLWALVALRLVLPELPESGLSLQPTAQVLPPEILYTAQPEIHSGVEIVDEMVNPILIGSLTPAPGVSANPTQIWSFLLSWVWAIGMGLMLLYLAVSSVLLRYRVRTAVPLERGVKTGEVVDTPFVFGILRPTIYLPSGLGDGARASVLAHERSHIRRGDHLWKPLAFLLLSIHWFNPLMWLAYILLCRDIEAACDEKVIRGLDENARRAYSLALLQCSMKTNRITACPLAFGEVGVKQRIKGVMNYRKPAFWVLLVSLILAALLAVGFLTEPEGMPLTEISDSRNYSDLFSILGDVTLVRGDSRVKPWDTDAFVEGLQQVQVRPFTLLRTRSENRDKSNRVYLRGSTYLNFSENYRHVWIGNGVKNTYTYTVTNPGYVKELFEYHWGSVPLTTWFLEDGAYEEQTLTDVPGLAGYTFTYQQLSRGNEISAVKDGERRVLLSGWPIHNAFFKDLNGGTPELCVTASYGFGIIDQRILAYDLEAGKAYTLEARGLCNYRLWRDGEMLMMEVTSYTTGETWGSAQLCMDAANGELCGFADVGQHTSPPKPEGWSDYTAEGVFKRETSGMPFATAQEPWAWCAGLYADAVEYARGNTQCHAGSDTGILLLSALEDLVPLLNDLSREDFQQGRITREESYSDLQSFGSETGACLQLYDPVNSLTALLRLENSQLELLLVSGSRELFGYEGEFSNLPPTQVWTIGDAQLLAYMEKLVLYNPFRHYTVGERYDWQEPMELPIAGGTLTAWLLEGWEYELTSGEDFTGIRFRPQGQEGWLHYSFWPQGYAQRTPELELYQGSGYYDENTWKCDNFIGYLGEVPIFPVTDDTWAYDLEIRAQGHLVLVNEGARGWLDDWYEEWAITAAMFRVNFSA